ncbi:Succinyl-CoA--L-malate CoA-transferase alpha subunit [Streptomyces spiroverticillatus]
MSAPGTDTRPLPPAPLTGLRVLDLATLFAGPLAATMLGDYGAEVVEFSAPTGPTPPAGTARRRTAWACGGRSCASDRPRSP